MPLGDYVNRGLDSRGVIETLIELGEHCCVFPILGNHDEMMLDARNDLYALDRFRHDSCPNDFIRTVWEAEVIFLMVPWKTKKQFVERNDAIAQWLKHFDAKSVVDIQPLIAKYKDTNE